MKPFGVAVEVLEGATRAPNVSDDCDGNVLVLGQLRPIGKDAPW